MALSKNGGRCLVSNRTGPLDSHLNELEDRSQRRRRGGRLFRRVLANVYPDTIPQKHFSSESTKGDTG
mgnify:CR=1 FL=1